MRPAIACSGSPASRQAVPVARRMFSSQTMKSARIPPESPRFVNFPQSVQPESIPHTRLKGLLPVPKRVNRRSDRPVPDLRKLGATTGDEAARNDWRYRMSKLRRQNFLQGHEELETRATEAKAVADVAKEKAARARYLARNQPLSESERLTRATVSTLMMPQKLAGGLPDPGRAERVGRMRANVEAKEARRSLSTRGALHNLYMNAKDFIVTQEQLDRTIEQEFGTPENPHMFGTQFPGPSVWHTSSPPTTQGMLRKAARSGTRGDDVADSIRSLSRDRLKRVAEELTGGKI